MLKIFIFYANTLQIENYIRPLKEKAYIRELLKSYLFEFHNANYILLMLPNFEDN